MRIKKLRRFLFIFTSAVVMLAVVLVAVLSPRIKITKEGWLSIYLSGTVYAATLTNSPSSNSGASWTNPANAYSDNAAYANITSGTPSGNNVWGTYGFSLAGSTITQVRVRYDAWSVGYVGTPTSETKRPTGDDADTQSCTVYPASPTTRWDKVDEVSYSDTDYYVQVLNGGGYTTFTFSAFSIPAGASISNVTVYIRGNNGGNANFRPSMKIGTTYYDTLGSTHDPSSMTTYSDVIANNPKTGVAWTVSDLNRSGGDSANYLNAFGTATADNNPDNTITWVYIVANYTPMEYDDQIRVDVSWDGGSNWSATQNTALTSAEATTWYDVTAATAWTPAKLANGQLQVRALAYTQGTGAEVVRLDWLPVEVTYTLSYDISNTPSSKAFGVVAASTTYYAKGTPPNNPVQAGDCTFTITNNGSQCDLDMKMADFTGGVGWNIVSGVPGSNEARITTYYQGQDPVSGLVLANTDAEFYDALANSATLNWDFKLETGTFTDGVVKSGTLTITAVAED